MKVSLENEAIRKTGFAINARLVKIKGVPNGRRLIRRKSLVKSVNTGRITRRKLKDITKLIAKSIAGNTTKTYKRPRFEAYFKEYYKNNSEKYKERVKICREEVGSAYVKKILKAKGLSDPPIALVEIQRNNLKLKRELKKQKQ